MRTKKTVNADVVERLSALVDELKADELNSSLVADVATVRQLHSVAREIAALADSIGRQERVDFNDVWPKSMEDKEVGDMRLPLFLGRTSTDEKLVVDLAQLQHLLVGGAVGQGKTNLLNTIVCGLARLLPPDRLRLVLVDTKCVEFARYASLPHLAFPVINDDNKCLYALRWLVAEMERRLKAFARARCRTIEEYNEVVAIGDPFDEGGFQSEHENSAEAKKTQVPLPYIVVVIDELIGIMFSHGKDFAVTVTRLAAKGRAVGIHLVVATQSTDPETLPAMLACRFPCGIAFKTDSLASRCLIRSPDADGLCAPGDMLLRRIGLVRAQCAWISAEEEQKIVEELEKRHPRAAYLAEVSDAATTAAPELQQGKPAKPTEEELYNRALEVVRTTGRASVSHLQRQMGIGYNHAARLLDLLEERGIVGPANLAQPRKILTP